ncbi:MAG TPA: ATP-binding cassette domain-containing protein [Kiritimatiellia bacterium]|nr:ATP-binding cassette domain-containing protein [Kiritimatiellia bacterium]
MIRFEKVSKRFGRKVVLDGVDMEIKDGETFVIVGSSGAGKSVTLKHMVRLLTPDSGRVIIGDDVVSEARGSRLEAIRLRFGYLFQGSALLQWLPVGENVALPLREKTDMDDEAIGVQVVEKLKLVGLEDAVAKYPSDLSGGMRKRVGLARAIVTKPEIILYDEPTSGLDPVTSRSIDRLIDSMRRELGVTSIVVTHDLHSALAIGSRIAMLHEGRIVEISTPEEFIRSSNEVIQDFLEAQYITTRGAWEKAVPS